MDDVSAADDQDACKLVVVAAEGQAAQGQQQRDPDTLDLKQLELGVSPMAGVKEDFTFKGLDKAHFVTMVAKLAEAKMYELAMNGNAFAEPKKQGKGLKRGPSIYMKEMHSFTLTNGLDNSINIVGKVMSTTCLWFLGKVGTVRSALCHPIGSAAGVELFVDGAAQVGGRYEQLHLAWWIPAKASAEPLALTFEEKAFEVVLPERVGFESQMVTVPLVAPVLVAGQHSMQEVVITRDLSQVEANTVASQKPGSLSSCCAPKFLTNNTENLGKFASERLRIPFGSFGPAAASFSEEEGAQGGADEAASPAAKPQAKRAKAGAKAKAKVKDSMHKYMLS